MIWCVLCLLVDRYQAHAVTIVGGQALCQHCLDREAKEMEFSGYDPSIGAMLARAYTAKRHGPEVR